MPKIFEQYCMFMCVQKQEPLRPIVTQEPQSSVQESSNNRNGCAGWELVMFCNSDLFLLYCGIIGVCIPRGRSLKLLRRASLSGVPGSPRLLQRLLSRRRSDGHAIRSIGSINPAFNPDWCIHPQSSTFPF